MVDAANSAKWFWAPTHSNKIYICRCDWSKFPSELAQILGEQEMEMVEHPEEPGAVWNIPDEEASHSLGAFLSTQYSEVLVTQDSAVDSIDWKFPVVSLGGPLVNTLTRLVGAPGHTLLPIWWLGMPYTRYEARRLGNADQTEVYAPKFAGRWLVEDAGFVARIRCPHYPAQFLYIIAGNYGLGTLGVVRHLTSVGMLEQLRTSVTSPYFQTVIRSRLTRAGIETALARNHDLPG